MERPGYINAATLLSKINDDRAKPSISSAYCPQSAQRSFCSGQLIASLKYIAKCSAYLWLGGVHGTLTSEAHRRSLDFGLECGPHGALTIVQGSCPADEFEKTQIKLKSMEQALFAGSTV